MIVPLIRLIRIYYSLPLAGGILVILYYLTAGQFEAIRDQALWAFLSLFCVISGGYALNDFFDIEADKINAPKRVLAAGKISPKTALNCAILFFAVGLGFAFLGCLPFALGILAVMALLVVYDKYSKRMGFFKGVLVAILVTSLYPLAFLLADPAAGPRPASLRIFLVWLFITALGYEMIKDIADIKGDAHLTGKGQYRSGKWFLVTARVCIVSASLVALLPYLLGYCKEIYLGVSVVAVVLAVESAFCRPSRAIPLIYAEVFLITAGSLVDLLVYGP